MRSRRRGARAIIAVFAVLVAPSLIVGATTARADASGGGKFVSLTSTRIANTAGSPAALGSTPFASGETRSMTVTGVGGVPSTGVSAVVLEMRVSGPGSAGTLSLYPDDLPQPGTTDLSFRQNQLTTGFAIVKLGSDGGISATTSAALDLQLYVEGYFDTTGTVGGGYVPVYETRILDQSATPIPAGSTVQVTVAGVGAVPSSAAAAFINISVTGASAGGTITAWADSSTKPALPTLRYNVGDTSTGATISLGTTGIVDVYNGGSTAAALTVDLDGYFGAGDLAAGGFNPVSDRLFDSGSSPGAPLSGGQAVQVGVAYGASDLPNAGAISAVALNVSATADSATSGTLQVYETGSADPNTTALAFDVNDRSSALILSQVGYDGSVTVRFVGTGTVSITVDAEGWFNSGTSAIDCSFTSETAYEEGSSIPDAEASGCVDESTVISNTNTPDGYHLPSGSKNGARTTFTSGVYYAYILKNGQTTSRVKDQFTEYLLGNDEWELYINNTRDYGEFFKAWYYYVCGVNISGQSDPTCDTWSGNSGASGPESGPIGVNAWMGYQRQHVYTFYGVKVGKKFPMLNDKIQWQSGPINIDVWGRWGWHIRGYDVCDPSLCSSSGTGS